MKLKQLFEICPVPHFCPDRSSFEEFYQDKNLQYFRKV